MEKTLLAPTTHAYALFVDSLCEGSVPVEFDAAGIPVLYPTLEAARRVIAEDTIDRLREYLAGERELEDAINPEEYATKVEVHSDGSIVPILD